MVIPNKAAVRIWPALHPAAVTKPVFGRRFSLAAFQTVDRISRYTTHKAAFIRFTAFKFAFKKTTDCSRNKIEAVSLQPHRSTPARVRFPWREHLRRSDLV